MPHHLSTKQRLRQSKKENAYNKHYKSMMRTALKKVRSAENKENAEADYLVAQSILDKLVIKGILKKNNASNKKAKLMKFISKLS